MKTECTRIEEIINNPTNRIVEKFDAEILSYEVHDKDGKVLLRAFDEPDKTKSKTSLVTGGFYTPTYERIRLARYWEYKILLEKIKNKYSMQEFKKQFKECRSSVPEYIKNRNVVIMRSLQKCQAAHVMSNKTRCGR